MSKKTVEKPNDNQYLNELHGNIKEDRDCLRDFREKLLGQVEKISNLCFADSDEDGIDSEKKKSFMMVQLADGIARISDCLSKSNQQLVEIAKLSVKKQTAKTEESQFKPGEDIFDRLSSSDEEEIN